ncbi:hypothetical protein PV328_009725 [Microctonus aethiopoides]|uniref:PHD-type domain-containing protein n=1 Tax=Microctonus aethiopoides TaxID=144406 RepID=A0AA39C6F3_9HYME|nr:hypothetical protein PV328_009725 [Microctonus aethiopoides]
MSETSKMGLFGSKEENSNSNTGQLNKDDSPERYAPYSVDSDSETYDTEALSIMDINDIIGVQTEPVGDSTLESEIAALTEVITDVNTPETSSENITSKDSNKIIATTDVVPSQGTEKNNDDSSSKIVSNKLSDNSQSIMSKTSVETDKNDDEQKNEINERPSTPTTESLEEKDIAEIKEINQSKCSQDVNAVSKSLQLIGEAYDSDDSQELDIDEMQIGKEPKVIFSCKPFVAKELRKIPENDNRESIEEMIIDKSVNDLTSIIGDSTAIEVSDEKEEETKVVLNESEKIEKHDEVSVEESMPDATSANNDCENVTDISNDVRQDTAEVIDDDLPKVNESTSNEDNESMKDKKSPVDIIDCAKGDLEPVNDDTLPLLDNKNHDIEKTSDEIKDECEQEEPSIEQSEIIAMEVEETIEEKPTDDVETCVVAKSPSEIESQEEIDDGTSSQNVNKINETNFSELGKPVEDLVTEITQQSRVHVPDTESESESMITEEIIEKEEIIKDKLLEINDEKITMEISQEVCEPPANKSPTISESMTDEPIEVIASEKEAAIQDITKSDESAEEKTMQIQITEDDDKSEAIEVNPVLNENFPEKIEDVIEDAPSIKDEIQTIIEQKSASESCTKIEHLEECADSPAEFVDALSPTHFAMENALESTEELNSPTDVIEKFDETLNDKESSIDQQANIEEVIDENNIVDSAISQDSISNESAKKIEISPETEPNKLVSESMEEEKESEKEPMEEEKIAETVQESVTVSIETKTTQQETKDSDSESSSINPLVPSSPTPELNQQTIPTLSSTDSKSKEAPIEVDTIEPMEVEDHIMKIEKIIEPPAKENEILEENHLLDDPESVDSITNIVEDISELKSILVDQEIQDNENDVTESITLTEDIPSTANTIIDIKQDLLSPSNELFDEALKDSISGHTDDSLDGILDLDLIPTIDDTQIKNNEEILENTVENDSKETDTIVTEPILEILPEPDITVVDQADNFLSDVIGIPHQSKIDSNSKMEDESSITKILLMDKEKETVDDIKLDQDSVQDDLPIDDTNDVEHPELDIPFTLIQEDKLEMSDDILGDPLATVDSGIEVSQVNTEITELESAVKFLQESEDNEIESPSVLSPKIIENIADEISQRADSSTIYSSNRQICDDSSDLVIELDTITSESIAISEAEIITEAAKLESEKKFHEKANDTNIKLSNIAEVNDNLSKSQTVNETIKAIDINIDEVTTKATQNIVPVKSSIIPKTSILEERLKEPPKIEIPIVDSPRLCDMPTTPKTSLLISRDSRISDYQKMMESPKSSIDKSTRDEIKITDTPRRDHEKHDIENVGSPRIILKIAKSALTDCAEPRSPKSPKIRSATNSPNPEDSPGQKLGKIKLKLSKSGHPSIIPNDNVEESALQWHTEGSSSLSPLGSPRRTESPLGMKIKLSKTGDASIIQPEKCEEEINKEIKIREKTESSQDTVKRTDSPLGMKIKRLTTGEASIIPSEYDESKDQKIKEKNEAYQDNQKRTDSHMGMKIKLSKKSGASIVPTNDNKEKLEIPNSPRRTESPLGMKIKLSKTGDASIIHSELPDDPISSSSYEPVVVKDVESISGTLKKSESSIGMKIKLSKDGDASIVHDEKEQHEEQQQQEVKRIDSTLGIKAKVSKTSDVSIIQSQTTELYEERGEIKPHKFSDTTTIESMKIRLSKTGHGTIVANDNETLQKSKELIGGHHIFSQKREQLANRSEVTIEPVQLSRRAEITSEISQKRKDSVTLSPIETKKPKIDTKLSQMLPEVTIQPVTTRDQTPINLDQAHASAISRQQMNVINQEISITQVRSNKPPELSVSEKLRKILTKPPTNSTEECEIIEHHPELIIVNENSNSSQDIMIIDEVPPLRIPEVKIPKKRGRPRRNPVSLQFPRPNLQIPPDPLALDNIPSQLMNNLVEPKENERPRRTCRSQKSYAPPKRGRGRGRGKRKFDRIDMTVGKRARLEQTLTTMEDHSTALITLDDEANDEVPNNSSELYKALRQPLKGARMDIITQNPVACTVALKNRVDALLEPRLMLRLEGRDPETTSLKTNQVQLMSDHLKKDSKDTFGAPDPQNWLTPLSKKYVESNRNDGISTVQVIDEETRMSAESTSRSQTPARNMSVNTAETIINEESQGSVLSTATTESEKVKVKNRRMEISFDPDEGPFTVEKIAEYEWPVDRKGETFMIQEQISQYLGVKSFKRKYPDLKRRMVDMEERNHLRENGLVSEAMCDMGLTAIYSSEVLDIMCSDFPDQYEEYRKHMREKQIKEHSKKQKELSAAATAEKNRIDLAEMAVQSALSWNVNLNKARRELRRCSLDLQTFTIHVPKKLQKIEKESKVSHYPVALIPGQYTDYYREYTPAELRYYPLNTVLYGPMRPNERKFDSQSEGSPSDSDSDSSSDNSSCSSSEGTQDTEESQSTMDDVDIELSNQKDKSLKCKMCLKNLNKTSKTEVLIQCGTCSGHVHPSCIDLTLDMVPHIQAYAWQCTDCKTCVQCHDPADEDKMLFCDMCDRGYHIYCVGLRRVPQGRWHCQECAICASCGSREAGGVNADRNSVALWQHEYKKGDKNTRVYVSTLCVPCSKLCGEQGSDNRPEKLSMRSLHPESTANS